MSKKTDIEQRRERKHIHQEIFCDLLQLTQKSVKILRTNLSELEAGLDLYSVAVLYDNLDKQISLLKKENTLHKSKNAVRLQCVKIVFEEYKDTDELELLLIYDSASGYVKKKWLSGDACNPTFQNLMDEIEQFQIELKSPIDKVIITKSMDFPTPNSWLISVNGAKCNVSVLQMSQYGKVSTYYATGKRTDFKTNVDTVIHAYQKKRGQHLAKRRANFKAKENQLELKKLQNTYSLPAELIELFTDKDYAAPNPLPNSIVNYLKKLPLTPNCNEIDWGDIAKLKAELQYEFGRKIAEQFWQRINNASWLRCAIYLE